MKIELPVWKPEYKSRITHLAFEQTASSAQGHIDRALQLYEAYCRTKDEVLYEVYSEELGKLNPHLRIISTVAWSELDRMAMGLQIAAEASVVEDGLRATMLYDLVAVIKG